MFGVPDDLSEEYQAHCVRVLIRSLENPEFLLDENFLAATVVLRRCEEMSGEIEHLLFEYCTAS